MHFSQFLSLGHATLSRIHCHERFQGMWHPRIKDCPSCSPTASYGPCTSPSLQSVTTANSDSPGLKEEWSKIHLAKVLENAN